MSVSVQTIPQDPSAILKDINGYFVPNVLSFTFKKTSENHSLSTETDDPISRQNGDIICKTDEEPKMSPKRKGSSRRKYQASSFLLDPFLKPVTASIQSDKENPVLKALFGGTKSEATAPWTYISKTAMNNCHPFKKTEFSHDLASDDLPAQIPKSLVKKPSKVKKNNTRRASTPEPKTNGLKLLQMTSSAVSSTSTISLIDSDSRCDRQYCQQPTISGKFVDTENANSKRKKMISQTNLQSVKSRAQQVNAERLIQLRTLVDNAVKNHKVYSMTGSYNSVRNALKQRGWIEKIDSDVKGRRKVNKFEDLSNSPVSHLPAQASLLSLSFSRQQDEGGLIAGKYQTVTAMRLSMKMNSGFVNNDQIHYTGQGEAEIINRMLKNVTEDLCWLSRPYPYYCYKDFDKFEMVNRLPRAFFSNKVGLCNSLQQIQWFYETGVCSTKFPRTYNMSTREEVEAFKEDYRLTACINILKWFMQAYRSGGEKAIRSPNGKVEMNVIEFALRRCAEYVKTKQHEDIDILDTPTVWEYQWDTFIGQYYKIINEGQILRENQDEVVLKAVVSNVQSMLNILKPLWPQFDIDGYQNYWIIKPGGRCCGAGIVIKNNLEQILVMVNPNSMKETRFVVQKYIERPLLIYNTKFDIRQWFLVTNVYPLTIWMYKESYLRFCSQPFSLKNTHESIHLCNNAVQRKYKNAHRDRGLPDENMWDCYTFQTYLKAIGYPEAWEKYIYPGMKEGFIGALLASQESMERKKNCFELYGADFMLSDTITDGPWLIEINSNPAMDSSTSVTARMCPQVLEDIIKVVIDRRNNKSAPTGAFEMVFKQNCPPIPSYLGMSLCIKGQKAFKHSGDNKSFSKKSKTKESSESLHYTDTEEETADEVVSASNNSNSEETSMKKNNSFTENNRINVNDSSKDNLIHENSRKERGVKRRKIDWVKKNISDLKIFHSLKQSKSPRQEISNRSSPKDTKANESFRKQLLKLLNTEEVKELLKEIVEFKKETKEETKKGTTEETLVVGGFEILREKSNGNLEDIFEHMGISENDKKMLTKFLQMCRENKNKTAVDWATLLEELNPYSNLLVKRSCPNFDAAFESELFAQDDKVRKSKSTESFDDSFISAKSSVSIFNSKPSLEYFREWKSKLHETRQTCEEMLVQLQQFKEENSKVKFQDAVKKRLKDEVECIKRARQCGKCKKLRRGKSRKEEGSDQLKVEERGLRYWGSSEDVAFVPLAINAETGAVRNINYSLPKIKQRSRPLLPNGTSGHGRKVDLSLEQTRCH